MCKKCYEVASAVIEDATERFSPLWRIDNEKLDIFEEYCDAIDSLAEEFDGESFEVEVDEIKMEISVAMECGEIIIKSDKHRVYDLAERAISCSFSASNPNTLLVKFVFPSVWERV